MRIDILTLFPGMFENVLGESILKIAREKNLLDVFLHDIRAYTDNKHGKVDDKPFGGGPGMVMRCQPVVDAVEAVSALDPEPGRLIFLTPEGRKFCQPVAVELAREKRLILVCGRYEGFDERIFEILQPERLSVGDFILTGGEIPAMLVTDAVTRLLPGVLGSEESLDHESFNENLLDYPQYTQPAEFRGLPVPEILRSGNHKLVDEWRAQQSLIRTRDYRPDLLSPSGDEFP
jgi:tRNA (guanine37-N1)-methyltransferase